jgi:hypothetical protein
MPADAPNEMLDMDNNKIVASAIVLFLSMVIPFYDD